MVMIGTYNLQNYDRGPIFMSVVGMGEYTREEMRRKGVDVEDNLEAGKCAELYDMTMEKSKFQYIGMMEARMSENQKLSCIGKIVRNCIEVNDVEKFFMTKKQDGRAKSRTIDRISIETGIPPERINMTERMYTVEPVVQCASIVARRERRKILYRIREDADMDLSEILDGNFFVAASRYSSDLSDLSNAKLTDRTIEKIEEFRRS